MSKKSIRILVIAAVVMLIPPIFAVSQRGFRGSGTFFITVALLLAGVYKVLRNIDEEQAELERQNQKKSSGKGSRNSNRNNSKASKSTGNAKNRKSPKSPKKLK